MAVCQPNSPVAICCLVTEPIPLNNHTQRERKSLEYLWIKGNLKTNWAVVITGSSARFLPCLWPLSSLVLNSEVFGNKGSAYKYPVKSSKQKAGKHLG